MRVVLGVRRAGSRIRAHIHRAWGQATATGVLRRDGDFLWLADGTAPSVRPRHDPDRSIERVADPELDAGLLLVARQTFGAAQPELVRETARQFGWRRTGPDIRARLDQRVERLLEEGELSRRGETLVASPRDPAR